MFSWEDTWVLVISLFVLLPMITIIHQLGHAFFVWIFGGKTRLVIGTGKPLFSIGPVEIRRIYFWHAFNQFEKIEHDTTAARVLIYLGGPLFNLLSIFVVNGLIMSGVMDEHMFWYYFAYFSVYYMFFALFPARYSKDQPSDSMAIYDLLKYGKSKDPLE